MHQIDSREYMRQQQVHELARETPALDASQTARALAVVVLAGVIGMIGVLAFGYAFPWRDPGTPWNFAGMLFGGTCMVAWFFALSFVWHHVKMWRADLHYDQERREAVLESYWNAQGTSTTELYHETTIRSENAGQVMLVAMAMHQRRNDPVKPYTVRKLQEPIYLSLNARAFDGKRQERIGQAASESEAQKIADMFARCGLIAGRREKAAGTWTADSLTEVFEKLLPEYTK
jgi:uncharacterized membrane protein